jgi:hypothetical protein
LLHIGYHQKQQKRSHCLENTAIAFVPIFQIGKLIMAVKTQKQAVETTTTPDLVAQSAAPLITEINLEEAIADQLLDDIDWQKVRAAIIRKAPAKLFAWLTSGNNTPINISAFPELSALPSSEDRAA